MHESRIGKRLPAVSNAVVAANLPLVVVVDDEASTCRALLRLFRSANMRAESYSSALDFLESLRERRPDCIVLDLQMPVMTGMELQEHLQKLVTPPPVIVITAFDQPGVKERCLALGAARHLQKPVEGEGLLEAVRTVIAANSGR